MAEIEVVEVTDSSGITVVEVTIPGPQGPSGTGTSGSGDVTKVGTPVDNQVGVWTGDGTIEGDTALTFDTATDTLTLAASGNLAFGAVTVIDDAAGTTTLQNIDAIDTTTRSTIFTAITAVDGAGSGLDADLLDGNNVGTSGAAVPLLNGANTWSATQTLQTILPSADGTYDIGSTTAAWNNLHLDTGATINVENGNAVITHSAGVFTVSTGDLRVTTAGTNAASVVTVGGSQTLTSKVLTSPTITTGVTPTANDGAALGSITNQFSDLFLATGGVINWNNGNATITHSAGALTSSVDISVPDEVYGVAWNGSLEVPTKNAVYDKMEAVAAGSVTWPQAVADGIVFTGNTTDSPGHADPILSLQSTGDGVNYVEISNADVNTAPTIKAVGDTSNIPLSLIASPTTDFTSALTLDLGSSFEGPLLQIKSGSQAIEGGPIMYFQSQQDTASDSCAQFWFFAKDSAGNNADYAEITVKLQDPTNGSEDGAIRFRTSEAGTITSNLIIQNGVYVGSNNDGYTTPGVGYLRCTGIELGGDTATDTTLTRSSAGVLAVEGSPVLTGTNLKKDSIGATFDGGGSAITAGSYVDITIPWDATVTGWQILADQTGSIEIDAWTDTYANYPPTEADSIFGGSGSAPRIVSATKAQDADLIADSPIADSLSLTSLSTMRFYIVSCTTITRATISLLVSKT